MIFRKILLFLTVCTIAFHVAAQTKAHPTQPAVVSDETIASILSQRVKNPGTGIVIGLIDGNTQRVITHSKAGKTLQNPLSRYSLFEIGSLSKIFTTTALALAIDDKQATLNDTVAFHLSAHLDTLAAGYEKMTLQQLATHTSGLPPIPNNLVVNNVENPYIDYSNTLLHQYLANQPVDATMVGQHQYSNLGMGLLGHILALQTKSSYEELIKHSIASPLNMRNTTITLTDKQQQHFVQGHDTQGKPVAHWDFPSLAGAGGLRANIDDMLRFLQAHLGNGPEELLPAFANSQQVLAQSNMPNIDIALGWFSIQLPNGQLLWHDGATGGFRAFMGIIKSQQRGVVILTNQAVTVDDLGLHLLDSRIPLQQ